METGAFSKGLAEAGLAADAVCVPAPVGCCAVVGRVVAESKTRTAAMVHAADETTLRVGLPLIAATRKAMFSRNATRHNLKFLSELRPNETARRLRASIGSGEETLAGEDFDPYGRL